MKERYTQRQYERLKKRSRILRIALVALTAVIILSIGVYRHQARHLAAIEKQRIEAENRRQEEEAARREMAELQEMRRQYQLDSLRNARLQDSLARLEPSVPEGPPSYTFDDIVKMVRKVAHENYFAVVWRIDEDNWIMHYSTGDGRTEKHYLRKFNVAKKTYQPAMRVKIKRTGEFYLASDPKKVYKMEGTYLVYYDHGREKARWMRSNAATIDLDTPEEPYEGYESWEDYYEDNWEDILYNGM